MLADILFYIFTLLCDMSSYDTNDFVVSQCGGQYSRSFITLNILSFDFVPCICNDLPEYELKNIIANYKITQNHSFAFKIRL